MKKLNKNTFKCKECNKEFELFNSLRIHIQRKHNTYKYYIKYIKTKDEGKCKICGKPTKFIGIKSGFKNCCCKNCTNKYRYENNKKYNIQHFGVENNFQRKDCKEKIKETNIRLYKHYNIGQGTKKQKIINTMITRYGVKHAHQNIILKEKFNSTMKNKYGYIHALQNSKILLKQQKTSLKIKKFKDTDLYYQGTYELDFLEKYYNRFKNDLQRGPSIKFYINNKEHIYFSDFYISSLNLVIEIKSSYYYEIHKIECLQKEKATINNGYKYILIIDKNYNKFENVL